MAIHQNVPWRDTFDQCELCLQGANFLAPQILEMEGRIYSYQIIISYRDFLNIPSNIVESYWIMQMIYYWWVYLKRFVYDCLIWIFHFISFVYWSCVIWSIGSFGLIWIEIEISRGVWNSVRKHDKFWRDWCPKYLRDTAALKDEFTIQ